MIKEQLIAARALVAAGWTQRFFVTKRPLTHDDEVADSVITLPEDETLSYGTGEYCYCTVGAVICSAGMQPMQAAVSGHPIMDELARYLTDERDANPYMLLTEWNDTPGRTQAEVLALFDKAIAAC